MDAIFFLFKLSFHFDVIQKMYHGRSTEVNERETQYIRSCCRQLLQERYSYNFQRVTNDSLEAERINVSYNGESLSDFWSLVKDMRTLNEVKKDLPFRQIENICEGCEIQNSVVGRSFEIILKLEKELNG